MSAITVSAPATLQIATRAIRHAICEGKLAYEFVANSYTASALNAALAVEQVYLRDVQASCCCCRSPPSHQCDQSTRSRPERASHHPLFLTALIPAPSKRSDGGREGYGDRAMA